MRVFVTGTGRCGTKTFAKACSFLTSHTSGHETHRGRVRGFLDFPDDHIEVDPHLSWFLPRLVERYPDAHFVHLWRPEDEVVASWERRGIKEHTGAAPLIDVIFQVRSRSLDPETYRDALRELYRNMVDGIDCSLSDPRHLRTNVRTFSIYEAPAAWLEFCTWIEAEGDLEAGLQALRERH